MSLKISNNLHLDKTKVQNFILLLALFFVFQLCFSLALKDLYIFQKARIEANLIYKFQFFRFVLANILVISSMALITIVRIKGFLYIILVLILIFFVFPSAILFSNVLGVDYRIFLSQEIFFLMTFVIGRLKIDIPLKPLQLNKSRKILLYVVLIGIIPFAILYLPHLNFKNLLLQEIYQTRELMAAKIDNLYTNYTYSWFNKIIIPILFVFGLYFRNKATVLFSALLLIFLFLCGAHKAVFVGLIMVLVLYKYDYLKKANYLLKFITGIALVSLLVSLVFNNDYLMVMTIRRAIFLPGLLDILYFDFFEDNHLYWSETFNGLFIAYPYEYSHSYIVGEAYFKNVKWAANNGLISDGFMNLGLLGVGINIVIVSIYFSILNQLNISSHFFGIFFLLFFVIISSSLPSMMLTHGGFLLIIVSLVFLKNTRFNMGR